MKEIFQSIQLTPSVSIKNRLAVAPMTTQQSLPNGELSQQEFNWLSRLSEDGYGLIISCAAAISKTSIAFYNQLSFADHLDITLLAELAQKMKSNGSVNLIQLCHAGSRAITELTHQKAKSASSYTIPNIPNFESPEELTQEEIKEITLDFVKAAKRAQVAGFDGIELHGANGYLFTQFISTMTNLRTDEYGGSLENRARLARQVVRACREAVGPNFVIGFRLSFEGMGSETGLDIDENIQISNWLKADGINYIHASQMNFAAESAKYPDKKAAQFIKENLDSQLLFVLPGSIHAVEDAQNALALGADMVAIGRAAIGNKDLPNTFKNNLHLSHNTPYTEAHLNEIGISEQFIDYVKNAPPLKSLRIAE